MKPFDKVNLGVPPTVKRMTSTGMLSALASVPGFTNVLLDHSISLDDFGSARLNERLHVLILIKD